MDVFSKRPIRIQLWLSGVGCLGLLMILYWGCTTVSQYEKRRASLSSEEQKKLDEYRAEIEIGRNMAGRLLQFYGTLGNEELLGYVEQVGAYVASYSDFPERRYMFQILDSDMINAFACPGGYILVTAGAIKNAETEAELAGVLAHEVAHVGLKHMFNKLSKMSEEELDKLAEESQAQLDLPEAVLIRQRVKPEESEVGEALAKYLSAGGAAGLNFIKAAGAGMAVMLDKGLEPEKEYEADTEGTKTAVFAGYDPFGLRDFLCRIKNPRHRPGEHKCSIRSRRASKKSSILERTHPPIKKRIVNIEKLLKELSKDGPLVGASGQKRFLSYKKKAFKN